MPLNDEPDQSIEIDLSEEDSETVNLILKNEKASLQIWLKVAVRNTAPHRTSQCHARKAQAGPDWKELPSPNRHRGFATLL